MNRLVLAEDCHLVNAIPPIDLDAAATNSDVIDLGKAAAVDFVLQLGVTGAATTVTVTACDDFTPSNETAIEFDYWPETAAAGDTLATKIHATTSGFATSTNDGVFYVIHVTAAQVNAVSGRTKVRLKCTDPGAITIGSCLAVLSGIRYAQDLTPTAIV